MRTNIVLDDDLVEEAKRLTGIRTKRELVHEALKLLVTTKRRISLLSIAGKVKFAAGYDYKKLREGRS
jgi:Arc/MetJ family transcription regulator